MACARAGPNAVSTRPFTPHKVTVLLLALQAFIAAAAYKPASGHAARSTAPRAHALPALPAKVHDPVAQAIARKMTRRRPRPFGFDYEPPIFAPLPVYAEGKPTVGPFGS